MYKQGIDISIKVDDLIINYNDLGVGKIPVIFIHGFPFDKSSWQPQLDYLKSITRVITYDLRGYGKSTTTNEKLTVSLLADDLVKFMDALQLPTAIVCGLSMGGYVLLNAFNRYPKRFEALILSDTQCNADSSEAKEKRFKNIQLIESGGISEFTEAFIKNLFAEDSFTTKKEVIESIRKTMQSSSPTAITATLDALAHREEMCFLLEDIEIPTLIISGKEDKAVPPKQSEFMHDHIRRSILQVIEKAGHLPNLEQPQEFNRHVGDFIKGIKLLHPTNVHAGSSGL